MQEEPQRDKEELELLHSTKDHGSNWEARVARKIESIIKERKDEEMPDATIMLEKLDSRIGKKYKSKTFDMMPGIHEVAHDPPDRVSQKQQGHGIVLKKNEALKNINDRISKKIGQLDVSKTYSTNVAEAGETKEGGEATNIDDFIQNTAINKRDHKMEGCQGEASHHASLPKVDKCNDDDQDFLHLPVCEENGLLLTEGNEGTSTSSTSPDCNVTNEDTSLKDSRTARAQKSSPTRSRFSETVSAIKRNVYDEFSSRSYRERNARYDIVNANVEMEVDRRGMTEFKACQRSICRGCWFMSFLLVCISLPFIVLKHDIKTYPTKDGYYYDPNVQEEGADSRQPTASPTSGWKREYSFYFDLLLPVSSIEAFNDYRSPQTKALNWLLFVDEFDYNSLPRQEKERTIIQRYALLVLFFSQTGWTERTNSKWAKPEQHVCEWKYVQCEVMVRKSIGYDGYKIGNEFPIQRRSQSVSGLNLKATFMRGSLVSEIGLLTDLSEYRRNVKLIHSFSIF